MTNEKMIAIVTDFKSAKSGDMDAALSFVMCEAELAGTMG